MSSSPILLKSKPLVDLIKGELSNEFSKINARLDIVLVGDDPASQIYVKNKIRFAQSIQARAQIHYLDPNISADKFLKHIDILANNPDTNGILIQLPVPVQLRKIDLSILVPWQKDVDGLHPYNLGRLIQNRPQFIPCTPKGIIKLMNFYEIPIKGQLILIIGRSLLVGRPLAAMLTNMHGTVILAHSKSDNLKELAKMADVIILAIGKAKFLTSEFLSDKKRPWIIDVGINKDASNDLCGDADQEDIIELVSGISPVPGGVGPMTVACLGENLLQAAKL